MIKGLADMWMINCMSNEQQEAAIIYSVATIHFITYCAR